MQEIIIFLHIPKTAGTSLRRIVEQQVPADRLLSLYPPFAPSDGERVRERLMSGTRYLFGHLNYGVHKIVAVDARYITLLREPVSRVVSYYRHQRTQPDAQYYGLIKKGLSLKQFVAERI
mgnify:FL=1